MRVPADRVLLVDAIQALAAEWRGRSMPDEAQQRFDALALGLEAYDAAASLKAAAPPDPREAVLRRMQARAQGQTGW